MSIEFKQTTLDNGLQIAGEVNPDAHTGGAGFFVKTGTRDEPAQLMGVSHFLEHMMFKGTDRRTAEQVNRDFDRIGAHYNAATSQETTTYWAHVLPEYVPQALDILSDMMRPSLREEDFDMEKNVILEEIGMYADRPLWVTLEHAMERYFGEHSLGYRILGTKESVGSLKQEQMRSYFAHHYAPDNMVLSLAGNIDWDRCVEQIEQACGDWKSGNVSRQYPPVTPGELEDRLRDEKFSRSYMVIATPAPAVQDDDRYAAAVLANLLGESDGSRLYWRLIDPGLADEAEISADLMDGTGIFLAYASCDPELSERVESTLLDVMDRAGEGLTEDEVERARNKIALGLTLQNERPQGRMRALGGQMLYLGEYRSLEEELRRVMDVGVDELRTLLEKYPLKPRTVVRSSPEGG